LLATPGGGGGKEGGRGGGRDSDKNLASLAIIVNYRKALPGLGPLYYGEGGRKEGARELRDVIRDEGREEGREGTHDHSSIFISNKTGK